VKNYLLIALILPALLFTGCQQTDVALTEEPPVSDDSSEEAEDQNLPTGPPAELAKVVVAYEKDGRIMLAEGDSPPQPLTEGPEDYNPLLSPDGSYVLFKRQLHWENRVGYDGGYAGSSFDLWLINLSSGEYRPYITEDILHPAKDLPVGNYLPVIQAERFAWLDSGKKFAFITYGIAHVFNFNNNDLWVANLEGEEIIELLPDEMGGNFAFSPDGTLLLVANDYSVSLLDSEGNKRLEVLSFEGSAVDYELNFVPQPVWAPDSSYGLVALAEPGAFENQNSALSFEEKGNVAIWKISRDGASEKLMDIHWPEYHELMSGMLFSPDCRYLINALDNEQVSESRLIDLEGTVLATYDYAFQVLSWSTDSQALILNNNELILVGVDGRQVSLPYTLQYSYTPNTVPKWISPTAFVVIDQAEDAGNTLWLADLDGRAIVIDTGVGNEFDALLID